jgi:hypothetical protein
MLVLPTLVYLRGVCEVYLALMASERTVRFDASFLGAAPSQTEEHAHGDISQG